MFKPTSQSSADHSHNHFDSGQGNDVDFSHENFEEEFQVDAEDGGMVMRKQEIVWT